MAVVHLLTFVRSGRIKTGQLTVAGGFYTALAVALVVDLIRQPSGWCPHHRDLALSVSFGSTVRRLSRPDA